jgi:hypothetical protein
MRTALSNGLMLLASDKRPTVFSLLPFMQCMQIAASSKFALNEKRAC